MAKTTAQLAERVMRKGGWIDAMQDVAAEDAAYITGVYTDKHAEWKDASRDDVVYWELASIPEAVFEILVDLIHNEVRGAFGEPVPTVQRLAEEEMHLKRLRRHGSVPTSKLPLQAEYF